jgi:hypothetical protein
VAGLKQYEQPAAGGGTGAGVPLEAIRGIGPKSAEKLREAGITDVADFVTTPGAEFVKISGFDKTPPKATTTETNPKSEPVPEKRSAVKKKATTRKTSAKKKKKEK